MSEVLADRYELGDLLGTGGMARVVRGHDRVLDREVAVKLLAVTPDAGARERFVREARSAAQLRHPDAVAVYDAGEADGQPYIVMELVEGETLGDLLDREGVLEIEEAVAITLGVLEVLDAAHRQGMIHRDVKPGNVLLPREGGVKLADFGIAKAMDETTAGLTATGAVMGTASYLAPELVEGGTSGPASDIYSVGCLLYALLAGHPPFTGDSAVAVAYAQRHTAVPPIEPLRPEVPPDLRAVLSRALEKDPAARYPDAATMRNALVDGPASVPGGMPVPSVPDRTEALDPALTVPVATSQPRGRAWTSRTVVAVLAAALVLGLAGWWAADRFGTDAGDLSVEPLPEGAAPPADGPADDAATDGGEQALDPDGDEEEPGEPEAPEEPTTVEQLISVLAEAPSGSYGKKHDDLLDDLVELTREDDAEDRAEDAESLREEVEKWVEKDELDPEIGRIAVAILSAESGGGSTDG